MPFAVMTSALNRLSSDLFISYETHYFSLLPLFKYMLMRARANSYAAVDLRAESVRHSPRRFIEERGSLGHVLPPSLAGLAAYQRAHDFGKE